MKTKPTGHKIIKNTIIIAVLAIVYFAAGKLGLSLAFLNESASAVWPPTGIALAALIVLGYRVWPAILIGAYFVNFTTSGLVASSVLIAIGNTLEGLLGAFLVNRFAGGRNGFESAKDVFKFALLAGGLSTAVSATIGVIALILNGLAEWPDFKAVWLTWWLGDMGGAFVLAPLLILAANNFRSRLTVARFWEVVVFFGLLVASSLLIFSARLPFPYLSTPFLVWAAFRFRQFGTSLTIVILSLIAIFNTLRGVGPFVTDSANESLLILQVFMAMMTLVALPLAALVSEYRNSNEQLIAEKSKIEAIDQAKTEFISIASHQLRTPLTTIKWYVSELSKIVRLGEKQKKYLSEIAKANQRLIAIVNELLNVSRLELGTFESKPQEVDLADFFDEASSDLAGSIAEKHIHMVKNFIGNPKVRVDTNLLYIIIQNLLSNAAKYTFDKGQIKVSMRADPDKLRISVANYGPGIPQSVQAQIFSRFFRAENIKAIDPTGTGLGLYITKSIVEKVGGKIWFESEENGWTTFFVDWPLSSDQE